MEIKNSDLSYLSHVLEERKAELRRSAIVFLKPWPEEEAACDRLLSWVKDLQPILFADERSSK